MTTLVEWAISAHGGTERWDEICRFRAMVSVTGALMRTKGMPQLGDVRIVGETRDQRVMIAPFPDSAHYATWEPHRATIEKTDGRVVLERSGLVSPFDGQERGTTWEPFQALQYTSATSWNWFVSPFIFARPDFVNEEIEPWKENGASGAVCASPTPVDSHVLQAANLLLRRRRPPLAGRLFRWLLGGRSGGAIRVGLCRIRRDNGRHPTEGICGKCGGLVNT